jgi:hypothetical protein
MGSVWIDGCCDSAHDRIVKFEVRSLKGVCADEE